MTCQEKLSRLLQNMNKSAVARTAGVGLATITNLLARPGSEPTATTAAKLARALGVDAGWLIDDTREWPPVRVESSVIRDVNKYAGSTAA